MLRRKWMFAKLKKNWKTLLLALAVFVCLGGRAYAYDFEIPLVIDGVDYETAYKSDPKYYGFASNNRTYVPLRFISETLGFDVGYTQATKDISISGNGQQVKLNVNSKNFTVNGVKRTMDVAPIVYKNRTYIPIRYVGESLKKRVTWNPNDGAVYIGHAVNFRDRAYSNYKKLDFSDYGFDLYISPNFQKHILIEKSPKDQAVHFYDKSLYKKGTMNGLVGSIGVENEKAFFPALNTYHENGKVLARYEFSDGSLKKLDPKLKGSDKVLKVFQEAVEIPTKNAFPNFDLKTLDNPKMTEAKPRREENPGKKPGSGDYTVFSFGNPKVTLQIPNDLMKELVVKKTTWRPGYAIYDKKILQGKDPNVGGMIKYYEQFKYKKGDYVEYDGLYKLLNSKGAIRTAEGMARDAQVDYRNKAEAKRFEDLSQRVDREVIVTIDK